MKKAKKLRNWKINKRNAKSSVIGLDDRCGDQERKARESGMVCLTKSITVTAANQH